MKPLLSLAVASLFAVSLAVPAAPAPTVDSIVADYVSARGGLTKIRSIQTLRQSGHALAGAGRQALVVRELKRPGKTRFEFTVQGITGVYVSDGRRGWEVSPFDGDVGPRPLPEEALQEAKEQADIEGPLVDWKAKGHQVELAGREVVGGREAYKLKVTLKSGALRYEYIDVKSHYELKMECTRQIRGRPVQMTTTFGDHRKAGGVIFPFAVEIAAAGRPQTLRVALDKIEVNPPLNDARFELQGATQR